LSDPGSLQYQRGGNVCGLGDDYTTALNLNRNWPAEYNSDGTLSTNDGRMVYFAIYEDGVRSYDSSSTS